MNRGRSVRDKVVTGHQLIVNEIRRSGSIESSADGHAQLGFALATGHSVAELQAQRAVSCFDASASLHGEAIRERGLGENNFADMGAVNHKTSCDCNRTPLRYDRSVLVRTELPCLAVVIRRASQQPLSLVELS